METNESGAGWEDAEGGRRGRDGHQGEDLPLNEDPDLSGDGREGGAGEGRADPSEVPAWLAALSPTLPEQVYAPYHPGRATFCYRKLGASEHAGLVVFGEVDKAEAYMAACLARHGYRDLRRLSLDQACGLAREHDARIDSVILADDPFRPLVQAVR